MRVLTAEEAYFEKHGVHIKFHHGPSFKFVAGQSYLLESGEVTGPMTDNGAGKGSMRWVAKELYNPLRDEMGWYFGEDGTSGPSDKKRYVVGLAP